jgi:hypothetical protein
VKTGQVRNLGVNVKYIEYQDDTSQEEIISSNDLQDKCEFNTIKIFEENEQLKRFVQDLGKPIPLLTSTNTESNVIKSKDMVIKQLESEIDTKEQIITQLKESLLERESKSDHL